MNNWNYVLFRTPRTGVESAGLPQEVSREVRAAVDNNRASDAENQGERGRLPQRRSATVSLGQTPEEVIATLGSPKIIVDLGGKKIYVYEDLKITFTDGKVSDVQ
jgi:hypothetical protein